MAIGGSIQWLMPMPRLADGRPPVISDGWGSPRDGGARTHKGADVMYRRPVQITSAEALLDHGSRAYEVPRGTPAFAAAGGRITFAKLTARGFAVMIDHGGGWETYYTHMEWLAPGIAVGKQVRQGEVLGAVGYDPLDKYEIRHLHFELHYQGAAVDPQPYMKGWAIQTAGSPLLVLLLAGFIGWGMYKVLQ